MPFDATQPLPEPVVEERPKRWLGDMSRAQPRRIVPMSDADVLQAILLRLTMPRYWCRGTENAGEAHCMVGWVGMYVATSTVSNEANRSPQHKRLLALLHSHLPRSAQRVGQHHIVTLGQYNDTHGIEAVRRVFARAYASLVTTA